MPRTVFPKAMSRFLATLLFIAVALGHGTAQPAGPKYPPTIVFMTDFGTVDDAVSICKGVMYSVAPDLRVVDLTHQVTPFSILDGARFLYGATPYYPAGVVFVGVVDPGVGSARKPIIVKTKRGQYFVLPDNGLITLVADRDGVEGVREISNPAWMIGSALSTTFHGRDIFSPAGAHLARGDDWTQAGPEMDASKLVRLDVAASKLDEHGLSGEVIGTDGPFGNLITNIAAEDFLKLGYARGQMVHIKLGGRELDIPFVKTFSAVQLKKPLLYIDSEGRLAAAVNQGSFAATYGIRPPVRLFIARKNKE
jgi:S-adenosylmethionine hydrolase